MDVLSPEILLISNTHDYSSDLVAAELHTRKAKYLRLNRDKFNKMELILFPSTPLIKGRWEDIDFQVSADVLKSIYFRAPVFLRDNYQPDLLPEEQLARGQWAAFLRALTIFEDATWVNHPMYTYQAEVKAYQLRIAQKVGFSVPESIATNFPKPYASNRDWIVKTMEPIILRFDSKEGFIYTNSVDSEELENGDYSSAPVMIQERIEPKVDVRVTIIGEKLFPVSIKKNGSGIEGDWRLQKNDVVYTPIGLPKDVRNMIHELMNRLNLTFGGMDLLLQDNKYYFLEVNPTGEWGWLMDNTGAPIDKAICDYLMGNSNV